jgi:hypothetical protein
MLRQPVQAGRRTSLPSKNIVLVLPGNAYTPDSLEQFSAAAAAADVSLLEIAWAVAAEEPAGTSYSLSQLSQLLFDSEGPRDQYATFNMLLADKIYFKSNYKVSCSAASLLPDAGDLLEVDTSHKHPYEQ